MRLRKEFVPGMLMVFSLALLLILQGLWLRSSWLEARDRFVKQTSDLFRNTIYAMHDSLIMRSVEPVSADSVLHIKGLFNGDSVAGPFLFDTTSNRAKLKATPSVVEIFVSSVNHDSLKHIIRPFSRGPGWDRRHRKFVLRLGADSLTQDSVVHHFSAALHAAGIFVPFTVKRVEKETREKMRMVQTTGDAVVSEPVAFNPFHVYRAYFPSTGSYLLKSIAPQILFSLFVTMLTAVAFYVMHQSIRSQRKLMRIKNSFISNISHELKTPVSTVSVALEALERFRALEDMQRTNEYLRMARDELNRLAIMTDKILQVASYENRVPEMRLEAMNLGEAVSEVLPSLKFILHQRNMELRYEKYGENFFLTGSRTHLVTAIYNLLDNAIKYSRDSSFIDVQLEEHQRDLLLSVKDYGIGIPPIYHDRIFEKFFRVPSGDVHNIKGYGLGLSFVYEIVKSHGGRIEVESALGHGSCFKVWLPKELRMR